MLPLLLMLPVLSQCQELSINEFMSDNESSIQDQDDDYSDWIELYNAEDIAIDLAGWYLSDDEQDPSKWRIEEGAIPPQGFLIVYASSKDRSGPGELHANFSISSRGEVLLLSNPQGDMVQLIPAVDLDDDVSYGSLQDGETQSQALFVESTPGSSNANSVGQAIDLDYIRLSHQGGFYSNTLLVQLESNLGADIHFTLDGSIPTAESAQYEMPLQLHDRSGEADRLTHIETGNGFIAPQGPVSKGTVLRFASFIDGQRVSTVDTETYFIGQTMDQAYSDWPVISLSVNADSLFADDRGIYVPGDSFDESSNIITGNYAMRGREWEREVHLEYYDNQHQKEFEMPLGLRIHGGSSRVRPQKSLRLYARGDYGSNDIGYPLFQEKPIDDFRRILLRSPASDLGNTMLRDLYTNRIIAPLDIDYMAGEPCVLFLNGEYWGVHVIRERVDRFFLSNNHTVDPENIDMLTDGDEVEEGDASAYQALLDYARSNDLSQDQDFAVLREQIDIENFTDYHIAQLYFANTDWPGNNIRFWRERTDTSQWRWIFYDCDYCMLYPSHDGLAPHVDAEASGEASELLRLMLANPSFKQDFKQRFYTLMSSTFSTERLLQELDILSAQYEPFVVEHVDRWSDPSSVMEWQLGIEELRGFILRRPAEVEQQLVDHLGLPYTIYPNPYAQSEGPLLVDFPLSENMSLQLELYDLQGKRLYEETLRANEEQLPHQIDLSPQSPGLYLLRLRYAGFIFTEKLLIAQ